MMDYKAEVNEQIVNFWENERGNTLLKLKFILLVFFKVYIFFIYKL